MKRRLIYIGLVVAVILLLGILEYTGIIWHNKWFAMKYQVKGLDVSHYQGKIDWQKVREEKDYRFVYIKATEGENFVDERFRYNWNEAKRHGMLSISFLFDAKLRKNAGA